MEKRKNNRIKKRIMLRIDDKSAILVDISREGVRYSTSIPPSKRHVNIELKLNGQVLSLKGYVRWIKRKVSIQKVYDVGVFIDQSAGEFQTFIESMAS